jgi:hypothetical protein
MIESPIGSPSTVAPGMLTCGTPVSPPCASMVVMRARSGTSTDSGSPFRGAGNGVDGRHRIVPGGSSHRNRARASRRICSAHCRSLSEVVLASASPRATLHCSRGLSRSIHALKVRHASHGCSVRCARAQVDIPGGAMTSSRTSFTSVESRRTIGASAALVSASAKPKASLATISVVGRAPGIGSPSSTSDTRASVAASRANHPVVSEPGACGIMPVRSSRPCVGRMP